MGSWAELDAIYPPGKLTPATALLVAHGHLAGVRSLYQEGHLANFLPPGLAYDADMLGRAEHYLAEVSLEDFLVEARAMLGAHQRLVLILQLLDRHLATGDRPAGRALIAQISNALEVGAEALVPYQATLVLKNNLALFPQ